MLKYETQENDMLGAKGMEPQCQQDAEGIKGVWNG